MSVDHNRPLLLLSPSRPPPLLSRTFFPPILAFTYYVLRVLTASTLHRFSLGRSDAAVSVRLAAKIA
uniref:Uncharacterized protein n=1 Tax=Rhizophora mucronata TaxID=61149 RepID=A0A2P2JBH4_RHIMU